MKDELYVDHQDGKPATLSKYAGEKCPIAEFSHLELESLLRSTGWKREEETIIEKGKLRTRWTKEKTLGNETDSATKL